MVNRETRTGLAPKSWTAVAVWLVIGAVVISRPGESLGLFFGAIRGTGEWVGYTAFADCGDPPPMEWMEPKPCPSIDNEAEGDVGPGAEGGPVEPPTPNETPNNDGGTASEDPAGGYVVNIDDQAIRSVLDAGTDAVVGLHDEVTEVQEAGGFTVNVGNGPTPDAGGGGVGG